MSYLTEDAEGVAPSTDDLARRYRIALDETDSGWRARCVEVPEVFASGSSAGAAVGALQIKLSSSIASWVVGGYEMPRPLSEEEGRLGEWANDLEILPASPEAAGAKSTERLDDWTLWRMARWIGARYRIIIESTEAGVVAMTRECPGPIGVAGEVADAIEKLRAALLEHVAQILKQNLMPPEAMQDIEARRHSAGRNEAALKRVA